MGNIVMTLPGDVKVEFDNGETRQVHFDRLVNVYTDGSRLYTRAFRKSMSEWENYSPSLLKSVSMFVVRESVVRERNEKPDGKDNRKIYVVTRSENPEIKVGNCYIYDEKQAPKRKQMYLDFENGKELEVHYRYLCRRFELDTPEIHTKVNAFVDCVRKGGKCSMPKLIKGEESQ